MIDVVSEASRSSRGDPPFHPHHPTKTMETGVNRLEAALIWKEEEKKRIGRISRLKHTLFSIFS